MKYVKSYLLTAAFFVGLFWVGLKVAQVAGSLFDADDIQNYLVYLGLVVGLAGPIGLYTQESNKCAQRKKSSSR